MWWRNSECGNPHLEWAPFTGFQHCVTMASCKVWNRCWPLFWHLPRIPGWHYPVWDCSTQGILPLLGQWLPRWPTGTWWELPHCLSSSCGGSRHLVVLESGWTKFLCVPVALDATWELSTCCRHPQGSSESGVLNSWLPFNNIFLFFTLMWGRFCHLPTFAKMIPILSQTGCLFFGKASQEGRGGTIFMCLRFFPGGFLDLDFGAFTGKINSLCWWLFLF